MKKLKAFQLFFFVAAIVVCFASCATAPKAVPAGENGAVDFSVFPAGAKLYLWTDVRLAKPLLEAFSFEGLSGKDASGIMDRTESALAAFYPGSSTRRFFLTGQGAYPVFRAGFSMGISRDWKKIKSESGNRYWYSARNNLGIALGSRLAYVTDGDPFVPGAGINPAPEGFEEFRRSAVLAGWLVEPSERINGFVEGLGLPVRIPAEDFFFGAREVAESESPGADAAAGGNSGDNESWELLFKIRTASASQANSLGSLISLARVFIQRSSAGASEISAGNTAIEPMEAAAILFSGAPEQDNAFLTLRTRPLDAKSIALLFSMFSIYLK